MPQFGVEHFTALGAIALAAVVLVWAARTARDENVIRRVTTTCGWLMLAISAAWSVYWLLPGHFDLAQSLPLHFSDASRYLASIALITRSGWSIAVLYYWGLTLNLQAVLTPDVNYLEIAWLELVMYWFLHGVVLIVPIVLTWGLRYAPTWRGYGVAYLATVLWAAIAFTVNIVLGTDYGYLNGAPEGTSLLDVLGPWPWYLLSEAVAVAVVWALITLPWQTRARRDRSYALGRGLVRRMPVGA